MIDKTYRIGLIEFLENELNPSLLIIFGSIRKGEYDRESDVDIFVESSVSKDLDLRKYGKMLGHNIQLFVESDIHKLPLNLFNNVANGIKLTGYLKIK